MRKCKTHNPRGRSSTAGALAAILVASALLAGLVLYSKGEDLVQVTKESRDLKDSVRRGGFTGPGVPSLDPLLGDYVNFGTRTSQRRTDIPRLLGVLKKMNAKDYMHLVWKEKKYPFAWHDFQLMAPEFQKAGIRLWLYLTPPSEGVPDPFGGDYVRWAVECAKIAQRCPIVTGICIDDFNGNVQTFTPSYCKNMMNEAHKIAPHLSLLVVCYFGHEKAIAQHVEAGAIDGVIFPYFYPHKNHSDTTKLLPQIKSFRESLDRGTKNGGLLGKMPLVVMVYAARHSASPEPPTAAYVKKCLDIGLMATQEGLADGVVTYCLPKNNPFFVKQVSLAYKEWKPRK